MKIKTLLLFAAVASFGFGALGVGALHAQAPTQTKRPAFYISEFEVTDPDGIRPYSQQVDATFAPFSGRYIVRGGTTKSLEGEPPKRLVIIAFDSMEQALAWYDSPAYRAIRPIRHQTAKARVYLVEGMPN